MKRIFIFVLSFIMCATIFYVNAIISDSDNSEIIINGVNISNKESLDFAKKITLYEANDGYGKYDIYKDDKNNQYIYLSEKNILCGIYNEGYSVAHYDSSKVLQEKELINIAEKFIKSIISNIDSYIYQNCEYSESRAYYQIKYIRKIGEYKTDDSIVITISSSGDIINFAAFNINRYVNLKTSNLITKNDINEHKTQIQSSIQTKEFEIVDSYLSKDKDGNLVIKYTVVYLINTVIENPLYSRTTVEIKI